MSGDGVPRSSRGATLVANHRRASVFVLNPARWGRRPPSGSGNVGLGRGVMQNLTDGDVNTATGNGALQANTTGDGNVATGAGALSPNTTGANNVAIGREALHTNTAGAGNVAIGAFAGNGVNGSNNIDIANPGVGGESGKVRIGTDGVQNAVFLAGVWNKATTGPTKAVVVNKNGRLATAPAPAAPLNASGQLSRLRAELKRQRAENRQQNAAIERLRQQMQNGG
jgi:hypothetical protein